MATTQNTVDAPVSGPAESRDAMAAAEPSLRLVLFSKNDCVECTSVKNFLTRRGVPYTEINVEVDVEPRAEFKGLTPFDHVVETYGRKMPTMVVEDGAWGDWWPGARPDKLIDVVQRFKDAGLIIPKELRHGK